MHIYKLLQWIFYSGIEEKVKFFLQHRRVTVAPGEKSKFWCILPLRAKSSFRLAVSCCYRQNRRKWHVGKRNFVQGYWRTFKNFNGTQIISIFYNGTRVKGSRPFAFNAHYMLRNDSSGKMKVIFLGPPNKNMPKQIWVTKSLVEKVKGPHQVWVPKQQAWSLLCRWTTRPVEVIGLLIVVALNIWPVILIYSPH